MKAYTTLGDGIARLQLSDRTNPSVAAGQVAVRMRAVSLNYRDLLVINGTPGWKPDTNRIPVSDGAGIVSATGEGVSRWQVGDRVLGCFLPDWHQGELNQYNYVNALGGPQADGVLAEIVVFDEHAVVAAPAGLSDAQAATLPVAALTAWHALKRRAQIAPGEHVLIEGTGSVALFALQFAVALGARPIVTSSSDEKLERASAMGAAAVINYRERPDWDTEVLRLTDGRGVEHVVELLGGENLNRSLNALKIGGTISYIGLLAGMRAPVELWRLVTRNATVHGIETGSREMFEEMNRFIDTHGLHLVISKTYPFRQADAALAALETGDNFGKIVIEF